MGEYSYILEQQGKTTSEKLAEYAAAIGWRDELATYRIVQDEYEMRAAAAAEQGISLLDEPPYTAEELAALDAESAAYYSAFAANYVATAAFPGSGSGTQSDPYIITNRAQLEAINDDLTAYYWLANNINLGGSSSPWTQIGTSSALFTGTFDGAGCAITGIYQLASTQCGWYMGNGGIIQWVYLDITLEPYQDQYSSFLWTGSSDYSQIGTVQYCEISYSATLAGGAYAVRTHNVNNCIFHHDVASSSTSMMDTGPTSSSNVINSYATGSIDVGNARNVGGFAGRSSGTTIHTIVNSVALLDQITYNRYTYDGGTPGRISGYPYTHTQNCYANADMQTSWTPTSNANGKDGADVSASTYYTQAFWETTLGWDFDTVWYWDDTEQLPKLRAFLHGPTISSVSATPTTGGTTTQITLSATVQDATSYQWQYSTNSGGTWQDITGATAATATWTPGAVGTYQVRLLATNSDGTTISDTATVTIYPDPTISEVTIYPNPSNESATFLISTVVNES